MLFTAMTIDQPGKQTAKGCHGEWMAQSNGWVDPDVVMLVGVNPMVSNGGFPAGNPGGWLTAQLRRGMDLIVIDPRRTDAARRATLFLQPRPGHDAAIFAAIARVIIDEQRYDRAFVADDVAGLEELRRVLEPFAPAEVAAAAGVDADDLVRAARILSAGRRGYVCCGTGPSMSGSTTLVEYLRMNLDTLCGHWLREGEVVPNAGVTIPAVHAVAQAKPPYSSYGEEFGGEPVRVRDLRASSVGMPTGALADEILLPGEGQVRALISCAGNPVLAWPDQKRTLEALASLELLVTVDLAMTPTARMSHYVLAPKMHLEMPGITWLLDVYPFHGPGYGQAQTYGQYTPAIAATPPGSELIEDWELFYGLAKRLGRTLTLPMFGTRDDHHALDMDHKPTMDDLLGLYMADARVPIDELKRHPHGAFFPNPEVRVAPKEPGWEGRLDLANADMMRDLAAIGDGMAAAATDGDGYPFRLISRRMRHAYNSATNHPATHRGRPYNPAFMHPCRPRDPRAAERRPRRDQLCARNDPRRRRARRQRPPGTGVDGARLRLHAGGRRARARDRRADGAALERRAHQRPLHGPASDERHPGARAGIDASSGRRHAVLPHLIAVAFAGDPTPPRNSSGLTTSMKS